MSLALVDDRKGNWPQNLCTSWDGVKHGVCRWRVNGKLANPDSPARVAVRLAYVRDFL